MRFSDFLLVSDPADLDFIVGYSGEQNIRIDVADFFASNISGSGTPGYVPVFTSAQVIGDSVIYQNGSNIVIGSEESLDYRLAVVGSLYVSNGAVIDTTISGDEGLRVIAEEGDIFVVPNDLGQSISSLRRIIHPPAILTTESATLGQLNEAVSTVEGDIELLLDLKVDKISVGAADGVASLDSGGKVPLSQIPDSIIGQVEYMGTWDALTNNPALNPLIPEEKGHYYVVSVAGVFGGVDYQVGDWIISNGIEWQKVDNTDAVTSVFGRIGSILALEGDYQAFYPRLSQAYDNPTWINSISFTKITDVPPFLLENQTITLSGDITGSGKTSISTTILDNAVTNSKLRDSLGTSVIGRASSTTGDPADIQATTDGHVLLRSGGNLLFGLISSDSIGSIDWSKITNTPTTLSGYGITDAYTKTEADNKFVPYTGANANVNLGSNNITANSFIKAGGISSQFLKADGSVDVSQYVPTTRSVNAGTGLTGGGNLSSDVTISFDTTWGDTRYAYRTRQLTINGISYDLSADRTWVVGTVNNLTTIGTSGPATLVGNTLNIPDYTTDLSGYVTLATDQTITGLKTIVRSGDVLNFKIGTDTLYGLKLFYSQNEISPSGEATWSFVNTFNRDGSGYDVTPLSFFRGVLVTGERLVSSSINTNLLNYYSSNPTGRYPVYAYNTGAQQFSDRILVGFNTGVVDPVTGLISDLPTGVVANFNGRVIGSNAVNSNEFVTLGQIPTLTGYVPYTGATSNVNLGEYGLSGGYLSFDLTPTGTPTTVGTMYWDSFYRTPSIVTGTGATTLQVGQEEVLLVHNNTGSALTDGQVVYVTGSTGELPSVSLADASSETTSSATLGVVTESIANGANGFVTVSGIVHGLNTLAYTEGDILWLSETAGQFTNVKPISPAHLVLIGYVIKRAGGNGSILVKIQNTQELAESSDVLISAPEIDGQGLFLQTISGVQLWRNRSIADVLGYTPANAARTLTINGTTYDLSANRTWSVGTVTSVSATSPLFSSGGINPNITIQQATGLQNGFLSYIDWNTFNNKVGLAGTGGTTNTIPKFASSTSIGNSLLTDNGSTLSYSGVFNFTSGKFYSVTNGNGQSYELYVDAGDGANAWRHIYGGTGTGYGVGVGGYGVYYEGNSSYNAIFNPSGFVTFEYSARSPIFYDSQNTAYYIDPNSTSRLYASQYDYIGVGQGINTSYRIITAGDIYLNGNANGWAEGTWKQRRGGGTFYDVIDAGNIGSQSVANSTQWDGYSLPTWTNWSSRGSVAIVVGQLAWKNYGNNHVIFDASQGTSPAGSGVNQTNSDVSWTTTYPTLMGWNGSSTYGVRVDSARNSDLVGGFSAATFYRNLGFGSGYPSWDLNTVDPDRSGFTYGNGAPFTGPFIHIGASGYGLQFNSNYIGGTGLAFRTKNGDNGTWNPYRYPAVYGINANGGGDLYAAIYYDQNDTGYYLDPNSTSVLYNLNLQGLKNTYLNIIPGNGYEAMVYYSGGSGSAWYVGKRVTAQLVGTADFHFYSVATNQTVAGIDTGGNVYSVASMRSPIYYDSNDTGYYIDPASTLSGLLRGNLRFNDYGAGIIGLYDSFRYQGVFSMGPAYVLPINGTGPGNLYGIAWSHPNAGGVAANLNTHGALFLENGGFLAAISGSIRSRDDMRAPIFYDSNDTFYFVDPNSTSRLSTVTAYGEYGSYRNDTQSILRSYNTSAGSPLQFYVDHNFANVNIGNNRGVVFAVGTYWQFSNSARAPIFYDSSDTNYYAAPSGTSRMLNLLLGGASATGFNLNITGNAQIVKSGTSTALIVGLSGVTGSLIRFSYNGGFVGSISTDGSTTAYNTSSDYRLKEEIVPIENPVSKILNLNPVNFKYKNSNTRQDGFIAHELQEVLPYMVVGQKDAIDEEGHPVYQEVDYSKLTPILIAAIKELKTEIETLKTRL